MSQSIVMPLDEPATFDVAGGRIANTSTRAATMFGLRRDGFVGSEVASHFAGAEPCAIPVGDSTEATCIRSDGSTFRARLTRIDHETIGLRYLPEPSEVIDLAEGQRTIVESIIRGESLEDVLGEIARYAQKHSPGGMRCSILRLDEKEGVLRAVAQPSLPRDFVDAIDRLKPAHQCASCGHAAFAGVQVLTTEIAGDPWWSAFADFMAQHGIRSSWSSPILSPRNGKVLGTFGMYYPAPRFPTPLELDRIQTFTHLAALAIDRHQSEVLRREHVNLLETARLRDTFFATVAHDFRTPLQAIVMGVGHLETSLPRPDADQRLALQSIKDAAAYLMNVAEDATQLARPASEVALSREASNLATLLRRAVGVVQEQASSRQVVLDVVTPAFIPEISVDPKRLSRVMVNLLANAVSYSPPGTRVRAEVTYDDSKATIGVSVTDSGPGLPPGADEVVFEPFVQVGDSRKQGGGIGLGLAIVKRFVEAHRGRVGVVSDPGHGAKFWFTLPVPPGARVIPTAVGGGAVLPAAVLRGYTVVVADDEDAVRAVVKTAIERAGAVVFEAANGELALQLLAAHRVDLLLLDGSMRDVDGVAALRRIRADARIRKPRIAMLTGSETPVQGTMTYRELGAEIVIEKPIRPRDLVAKLASLLQGGTAASAGA